MRKLCPNYDFEDGLETVLEVPIPDEDFTDLTKNVNKNGASPWHSMKSWIKPQIIGNGKSSSSPPSFEAAAYGGKTTEIQLLLGVVGAPLIPLPLKSDHILHSLKPNLRDHPIEASMAKYIIEQYLGAVGGEKALNSIDSLCAVGKVRMAASEFSSGDGEYGGNREVKGKNLRNGGGEMGGFVLWQKRPELWCLELVLSGCKISAGSDGKVAWRQTPWHHSHASRGPPRPLRRSLQGLDPRAIANLFSNSVCIGEKEVNNEDCFILKLEADPSALKARSSSNVEIIRHTVWGYFSQKTGLLIQLDDSHMLGIKHPGSNDSVIWETTMESFIEDYKEVDGINIAHKGKTLVSLFRFGECPEKHSRTRMEEIWEIEEMDFNIKGLSMDCFLPPRDLKKEDEEEHESTNKKDVDEQITSSLSRKKPAFIIRAAPLNVNPAKVVAVDAYEN